MTDLPLLQGIIYPCKAGGLVFILETAADTEQAGGPQPRIVQTN